MEKLIEVENLAATLREFAAERNWAQFHTPKNLTLALAGEVGELCAEMQWLDSAEATAAGMSPDKKSAIAAELADVAIYLARLADQLDIDLDLAIRDKLDENEQRYPVSESFGSAAKATRPGI